MVFLLRCLHVHVLCRVIPPYVFSLKESGESGFPPSHNFYIQELENCFLSKLGYFLHFRLCLCSPFYFCCLLVYASVLENLNLYFFVFDIDEPSS